MEKKIEPRDEKPENFYGQSDSAYVRIQYVPEVNGFKFSVRNELFHHLDDPEQVDEYAKVLATLVRGMAEMGLTYSTDLYHIGLRAEAIDYMIVNTEQIEDVGHRELLLGDPKGSA